MADKYEAYCVKCREKREFEGTVVELKNGRKATFLTSGSRVMNSWSDTTALPWVSALKSVDLPALV